MSIKPDTAQVSGDDDDERENGDDQEDIGNEREDPVGKAAEIGRRDADDDGDDGGQAPAAKAMMSDCRVPQMSCE